jgi:hypothetical protein
MSVERHLNEVDVPMEKIPFVNYCCYWGQVFGRVDVDQRVVAAPYHRTIAGHRTTHRNKYLPIHARAWAGGGGGLGGKVGKGKRKRKKKRRDRRRAGLVRTKNAQTWRFPTTNEWRFLKWVLDFLGPSNTTKRFAKVLKDGRDP